MKRLPVSFHELRVQCSVKHGMHRGHGSVLLAFCGRSCTAHMQDTWKQVGIRRNILSYIRGWCQYTHYNWACNSTAQLPKLYACKNSLISNFVLHRFCSFNQHSDYYINEQAWFCLFMWNVSGARCFWMKIWREHGWQQLVSKRPQWFREGRDTCPLIFSLNYECIYNFMNL